MTRRPLEVVFWRRAARQVEDAVIWWRANREGDPDALTSDLQHALELVAAQPGIGVRVRSTRLAEVRRVLIPRVGYFLYYRVVARQSRLEVLAFWHSRRGSPPRL